MVVVTIPIAVSAVLVVVFGSVLALLGLEYRGKEFLRWLSLGRGFRAPGSVGRGNAALAPFPRLGRHRHQRGVAPLVSPGNATRGIELLRIGIGMVWALNLLFLVLPVSGAWSSLRGVALSYGAVTLGGPGLLGLVGAHATVFAWLIALAAAYLAVAFLFGVTTRLACGVGAVLSVAFFVARFGSPLVSAGGTGVGPQPLYLAIYAALWIGQAGQLWAIDGQLWKRGWGRHVPQARWFATVPPAGTPS